MRTHPFAEQLRSLTESVYDAALDANGWGAVMAQMHSLFKTTAETFYLLNPATRRMRDVHLAGIAPRWINNFDEAYFSDDNPWMQLSERLHRPGVVRTNERLIEFTREREVLYRSQYYNDWMRPQDFRYTIGNTLLREPDLIANVTLLRPHGMPTFSAHEVMAFEQLSSHMTRALRFCLQLEAMNVERTRALLALTHLPQAALVIDPAGHVLHANPAAESMLRMQHGLVVREGRLAAASAADREHFSAWLVQAANTFPAGRAAQDITLWAERRASAAEASSWTVQALPLAAERARYRHAEPALLVLVTENGAHRTPSVAALREHFGLTPAEARLAHALATGCGLRAAAGEVGIGYETARSYVKILFQKTATRRQADLVRRILDIAPRH